MQIDWKAKRPFKKFSNTELHWIKDNPDLNAKENAGAEAELEHRRGRPKRIGVIIAAAGLILAAIYNFGPWIITAFKSSSVFKDDKIQSYKDGNEKQNVTKVHTKPLMEEK